MAGSRRKLVITQIVVLTLSLLGGILFAANKRGAIALPGSSLEGGGLGLSYVHPFLPGQEWLVWDFVFANESSEALVLEDISVPGRGMGDVVEVVRIEMERPGSPFVDGSVYGIYPPAWTCRVAQLQPLEGYVLQPGQDVRAAIWLRAVRPGRWRYERWDVTYRQHGLVFVQSVDSEQYGRVGADGRIPDMGRGSPCTRDLVTPLPNGTPSVEGERASASRPSESSP